MKPLYIISGGTSGIGLAIAQRLADTYALALIYERNTERADESLRRIRATVGATEIRCFSGDLAAKDVARRLCQEIEDWSQRPPAALINSAGRSHISYFATDPLNEFEAAIEANLYSCMRLTHEVVRRMIHERTGRIVNMSSVAAERMLTGNLAYAMGKIGIETFTKGLAEEVYRRGVRVNCVRPGLVETPMSEAVLQNKPHLRDVTVPLSAIVGAVEYFLSPAADAVSGSILAVSHTSLVRS